MELLNGRQLGGVQVTLQAISALYLPNNDKSSHRCLLIGEAFALSRRQPLCIQNCIQAVCDPFQRPKTTV